MLRLMVESQSSPVVDAAVELLSRHVGQRCGVDATLVGEAGADVVLRTRAGIGENGFCIEDGPAGGVIVTGHDAPGLLYGVGKLLRTSRYAPGRFEPGAWRGTSVPERSMRGMYFASHFYNYYHVAPVAEVVRYIEELALWGVNLLVVWFDFHHFDGIDDPRAREVLARLRAYLRAAKRVGMKVGLTLLANEGYNNSPEQLRVPRTHGTYGVELCPSKPGAPEIIVHSFRELFGAFSDIGIDLLNIWPYDQGGCGCAQCWPWGANGFLKIAEPIARLGRELFPGVRNVLSTWYYDLYIAHNTGEGKAWRDGDEWDGLLRAFERRPDWCDAILLDEVTVAPKRLMKDGRTPAGLPLVNFPEISMRKMWPWGGYGANPQPAHLPIWRNNDRFSLAGGFAYSEGKYEDMNKAIVAQHYWCDGQDSHATVREYAAFEYGEEAADDVVRAVRLLEHNMERIAPHPPEKPKRLALRTTEGVDEAWALLRGVDARLPAWARDAWRWRVLYLRGLIDHELAHNDFKVTDACDAAFDELARMYFAHNGATRSVYPPSHRSDFPAHMPPV